MIDQLTIDRIFDAANIHDVVSEFVTLQRRGVNYVGLCPFHSDTTPSFYVSPAKNICKCFACGEGGTAVHFIMKHEQLSYYDALRFLAKKYNIEIQERELSDDEKRLRSDRESMLIVNSWAQEYFSTQLHQHEEGKSIGLRYFIERGFHDETIRKFQLGYGLEEWDALYKAAVNNGYKTEYLEKTGLVTAGKEEKYYDRFRGRVIFPIHSLSGKVVGFGGRILKNDKKIAKYVNSPESEVYHKSNELYGIYFAKRAIQQEDRCYLVEGYTDVISMHQAGLENVVASSGTALTGGQIRLIKRFTQNITVIYDGDAAGIKAALRGIDMLLEEDMKVKVLLLPDGEDPDSFARKHSASEFQTYIKNNESDFIRFKAQLLLDEAGNDPIKRSSLISDIIRSIAVIPNNIDRAVYTREVSKMMEVDEQVVINEVNTKRLKRKDSRTSGQPVRTLSVQSPDNPPEFPEAALSPEITDGGHPYDPNNIPPPVDDMGYAGTMAIDPNVDSNLTGIAGKSRKEKSPFEAHELALMRYVIRYGAHPMFGQEDKEDIIENGQVVGSVTIHNPNLLRVASYIHQELTDDDLTFTNPLLRKMFDEVWGKCSTEGFSPSKYFLSHPDPQVSLLAADLISEKYQLSKYHTKYQTIDDEEKRLDTVLVYDILALKQKYLDKQINQLHSKLKEAQTNNDEALSNALLEDLTQLNITKANICKELGERIVTKM